MASASPRLPFGRSLADFPDLSVAEQALLDGCREGRGVEIAAAVPDAETDANRVRAGFVRFLALGGDAQAPVHERGIHLEGAWLTGPLNLESADVRHRLILGLCRIERVEAQHASLRFLHLGGSRLEGEFVGHGLECRDGIFLREGFHATGAVRLVGATIGGDLDCSAGRFEQPDGEALNFETTTIGGTAFLSGGFHATGSVRFPGAVITANLFCTDARFEQPGGEALNFDGATIGDGAYLAKGFHATGGVRFLNATIGALLDFSGARLENEGGEALNFDRATVKGNLFMRGGFHATGEVRLINATIGGSLFADAATFDHGEDALTLDQIVVASDVWLNNGFAASGTVRMIGASIDGALRCQRGSFSRPTGHALLCERATVKGAFEFTGVTQLDGAVNLAAMYVAQLSDDIPSWRHAKGRISLDGFTYDRFGGDAPTDSVSRIEWLCLQRSDHLLRQFRPQPWEQLIAVLRAMGHPNEARRVAMAKQRQLRRAGRVPRGARAFHRAYGGLIGYGYQPPRLVAMVFAMWAVCTVAYWAAVQPSLTGATRLLTSTSREPSLKCLAENAPLGKAGICPPAPPDYDNFVASIYSLDVMLPIVSLGYKAKWEPVLRDAEGRPLRWGWWLRMLYWLEIAFGWVAGLLLVGVLGTLVKKD